MEASALKNLQEATERICELKGSLIALDALLPGIIAALSRAVRSQLMKSFEASAMPMLELVEYRLPYRHEIDVMLP